MAKHDPFVVSGAEKKCPLNRMRRCAEGGCSFWVWLPYERGLCGACTVALLGLQVASDMTNEEGVVKDGDA